MVDNDGHFLLIEAAATLPRWLKPENSAHRCAPTLSHTHTVSPLLTPGARRLWITRGAFHLIPLPRSPSELVSLPVGKDLTLAAALNIVHKVASHASPFSPVSHASSHISHASSHTSHASSPPPSPLTPL